jgi:hypothetical protein
MECYSGLNPQHSGLSLGLWFGRARSGLWRHSGRRSLARQPCLGRFCWNVRHLRPRGHQDFPPHAASGRDDLKRFSAQVKALDITVE